MKAASRRKGAGIRCAGRRDGGGGISSVQCGGVPSRGSLEGGEGFCFDLFSGVSN